MSVSGLQGYADVVGDLLMQARGEGLDAERILRLVVDREAAFSDVEVRAMEGAFGEALRKREQARDRLAADAVIASSAWAMELAAQLWPETKMWWERGATCLTGRVHFGGALDADVRLYPERARLRDHEPQIAMSIGYARHGPRHELLTEVGFNGHLTAPTVAVLSGAYLGELGRIVARGYTASLRHRVAQALLVMAGVPSLDRPGAVERVTRLADV